MSDTADVMNKLEQWGSTVTDTIAKIANQYGQQAVDSYGTILQYQAIGALVSVPMLGLLVAIIWYAVVKLGVKSYALDKMGNEDESFAFGLPAIILGIGNTLGSLAFIVSIFKVLLDPLIWLSAFDKHMAIVVQIVEHFSK